MIAKRFRNFLPIVIDVETGGLNPQKDALLELAAITLLLDDAGLLYPAHTLHYHILPFPDAHLDPDALSLNRIDPFYPLRFAIEESQAMSDFSQKISQACLTYHCKRAVLVGHNAWFDHQFLNAALNRSQIKSPFHPFTSFDTATLSALAFGQTVLSKALKAAHLSYNPEEAHSALYDAQRTAALFCTIVNQWKRLSTLPSCEERKSHRE